MNCCAKLHDIVNENVRSALLRMAERAIKTPQLLHETNEIVLWIKEHKKITRLQASILATELNQGFLFMDDKGEGQLHVFEDECKESDIDDNLENYFEEQLKALGGSTEPIETKLQELMLE